MYLDYFTKRILSLKSTTLGCKDKDIKISEFVAKIWKTHHLVKDSRSRLSLSCLEHVKSSTISTVSLEPTSLYGIERSFTLIVNYQHS